MKQSLSLLILTFIFGLSVSMATNDDETSTVQATKWSIDQSHSKVGFTVRHIFTPVDGKFNDYTGDIYFDPTDLAGSSINVEVMISSIDTDNEKRDGHLQSGDFFDAENFPKLMFKSKSIKKTGDNEYVAVGDLTIKDVTKEIELPFTLLGVTDHPFAKGKKLAAFTASTKIMRNEYNVGSGKWVETAVVGDEVDVNISLEVISE